MHDQLHKQLHDELSRAITHARGGKKAGQIANHILTNDQSGTLLIGITTDGCVLEYSRVSWTLKRVPITDEGGLDGMGASVVATLRSHCELERWLWTNEGELLEWVHPRFRWTLD